MATRTAAFLLSALALPGVIFAQDAEFSDWLHDLNVPIPSGIVFAAMPVIGDFLVTSGQCRNLTLGRVSAIDNSSGVNLELGLSASGLAVSCTLAGESTGKSNGTLMMDLTMINSSFTVALKLDPWYPSANTKPQLPLPIGGVTMSRCSLDFRMSNAKFNGTSPAAALAQKLPAAAVANMMGSLMEKPVCDILAGIVNKNASSAFAQGRSILGSLLRPVQPLPEPRVLERTLDWGSYPPLLVAQDMIATRFPVWAGRYLTVLNVPMQQTLVNTTVAGLSLSRMTLVGKANMVDSGIRFLGKGSKLGLEANLSSLQLLPTLGLSVRLPGQKTFRHEFRLSFGLSDFDVDGRLYIDRGQMLKAQEQGKFHHRRCMIDCARDVTNPANGSVGVSQMHVTLQKGTNIAVVGTQDQLLVHGAEAANRIIATLQRGYMDSINALINGGLGLARPLLNAMIWYEISRWPPCEASIKGATPGLTTAFLVISCSFTAIGILAAVISCLAPGNRAGIEKASGDGTAVDLEDNVADCSEVCSRGSAANTTASTTANVSLGATPLVPRWLAVSYPMFLLAVAFLFLFADFSLAALVNIRTAAGGKEEVLGPLFSFSMVNTVKDARRAGAPVIAAMTILMSGAWPLAKLSLLGACWLAPPRWLPVDHRGRILRVLDVCGKYSFLDSWFLVLSMSLFALSWSGNSTSFAVEVVPTTAFYAFIMATFLSLALGHVASEFHRDGLREHRRSVLRSRSALVTPGAPGGAAALAAMEDPEASPLCSLASRRERWLVGGCLAATLALAGLAAFVVSFEVEIGGLVGQVLDIETKEFSLVGIAAALRGSSKGQTGGLVFLAALFLVLTLVLPLLLLAVLLALWVLPMPHRAQDLLLYTSYIMDCWASMDVALLTLTIQAFELDVFTEFMLRVNGADKVCGLIKDITRSECVDVNINMLSGFVLLLLAGIALVVVPKVAHYHCKLASDRREEVKLRSKVQLGRPASIAGAGAIVEASAGATDEAASSVEAASSAEAAASVEPAEGQV